MTGFIARIVAGLLLLAGLGVAHAQAPPAQTEPLRHEIRVWAARDVAPGPKIRLSINTRNVPVVEFAAYRIDPTRWLLQRDTQSPKRPQPLPPGRPALTWAASVVDKTRKPDPYAVDIFYSRQVNLPPLPPGVYLIAASGGGKDSWAVVNITNLAVVLKRAPRRVLAWVTDYAAGTPLCRVAGAAVGQGHPEVCGKHNHRAGRGVCLCCRPAPQSSSAGRARAVSGQPKARAGRGGTCRGQCQPR